MARHFIALIHKEPESGYGISFPDLLGVTAVADTLHEALLEADAVLGFAFEDWKGPLPSPRTLDDKRFLDEANDAVITSKIQND